MDFWSNYISHPFQFSYLSHSYYKSFKVFWLLLHQQLLWTRQVYKFHCFGFHILIRQIMFIQYLNIWILVYITTTISLWNHMSQFNNTVRPVVLLAHVEQLSLKLSITDLYAYLISVEYLCYKVFIYFLCESFGGNRLFILTTFPYNYNSSIQGGCKILLKLFITDLYMYCILVEYLCYKVLLFCLYGSFGRNSLLIWTNFPYNSNHYIQGVWKINLFHMCKN